MYTYSHEKFCVHRMKEREIKEKYMEDKKRYFSFLKIELLLIMMMGVYVKSGQPRGFMTH